MRNIKLTLSYDGTDFHGWQRQPDCEPSRAFWKTPSLQLTGTRPATNGQRTNRRRCACAGQVVNFLTPFAALDRDVRPGPQRDFASTTCAFWPPRKNLRLFMQRSTRGRRFIATRSTTARSPTSFSFAIAGTSRTSSTPRRWPRAGRFLLGRHDFRSFETEWPNRMSSVRTIYRLDRRAVRVVRDHRGRGRRFSCIIWYARSPARSCWSAPVNAPRRGWPKCSRAKAASWRGRPRRRRGCFL